MLELIPSSGLDGACLLNLISLVSIGDCGKFIFQLFSIREEEERKRRPTKNHPFDISRIHNNNKQLVLEES